MKEMIPEVTVKCIDCGRSFNMWHLKDDEDEEICIDGRLRCKSCYNEKHDN